MAEVRPFAAVRYDEEVAGPLEQLVAPPYDVLSASDRDAYRAKSPYNVVHLTLPDSEQQAADDFRSWREQRVLVDEEPSFWFLEQHYAGPDGLDRIRRGLVASLKAEPYAAGAVLPHERTHRDAKEGRLRLVRAVGAQLEPIFLLYEGMPPISQPEGEPLLEVPGAKLWPLPPDEAFEEAFLDRPLLIADGHHRYETAVEYAENGGSPWLMVVLVSTSDPGLTIFPTHRIADAFVPSDTASPEAGDPRAALESLAEDEPAAVVYTRGGTYVARGAPGQLGTQVVDALASGEVAYTADADEAVAAVDDGRAEAAFLLRPTRVDDVFAFAKRGDVLPPKTTYFYPKLLSGLLFHPL